VWNGHLIYIYWSDDLFSPERLAAVRQNGKIKVHDLEALDRFVEKYEADRAALALEGKVIPPFAEVILGPGQMGLCPRLRT
jgi:hypothetical protein